MDLANQPPFIDTAARDRVTVSGADAATYLQSQLAQEIRDLSVGESRWTLLLEPTGKVVALARIARTDDATFVLDTDAGFGDELVTRLNRFKIRVDADVVLASAGEPEPGEEFEVARIAEGWPRMGHEIVPGQTIPAVTGVVEESVNFTKGCYPGQELVERMHSRGADAPMSLRIVDVGPDTTVGDALLDDAGTEIGEITSVSPTGGIALAYVKRNHDAGRAPAHTR